MPPGKRQGKKVPEDQPDTVTVASDMAEAHTSPDLISFLNTWSAETNSDERRNDSERNSDNRSLLLYYLLSASR